MSSCLFYVLQNDVEAKHARIFLDDQNERKSSTLSATTKKRVAHSQLCFIYFIICNYGLVGMGVISLLFRTPKFIRTTFTKIYLSLVLPRFLMEMFCSSEIHF